MRRVVAGLTVLLTMAASPAFPSDKPASAGAETRPETIRVPVLQLGRVLMNAQRWQEARDILWRLKPGNEEERIERLFLLGLAEAQLGQLPEAAGRFEAILAVRPELTRVRLELARVYGLLGRDEKARFHFEASLADELPSSVEDAVEAWLDRIDARKRWAVSLSTAILPESNPAKRTESSEVRIGGVPFRLNEDAREASGTGLLLSAGAQYSPLLSEDWRGVLAASGAAKLYERADWDDISVQSDIGIARLFDRGSAAGGLRLARRWLGGEHYSTGIGPWMRGRLRLTPALRLDAALGAERRTHPDNPGLDGWTVSLRPGLDHALSSATTLRAELDLEHVGAREPRHGSRMGGLALSLSHAFRDGLSVSPRAAVHWRRYRDRDPLFRKTRSDQQTRLSVTFLHRALKYRGFAPHVGVFVEWNRSSIPVNDWRNQGVVLGLSRTF